MATREELFAAVRLVHGHCKSFGLGCFFCPLNAWCKKEYGKLGGPSPERWPDPEEGGGEE